MHIFTRLILAGWLAAGAGLLTDRGAPALAQELSALARLDPARSGLQGGAGNAGLEIDLQLSQAVPWRVFLLDDPRRLVVDFREVDWGDGGPETLMPAPLPAVKDLRFGRFRAGWSRLVVELAAPLGLATAEMQTDSLTGEARVHIALDPVSPEAFAAAAGMPATAAWGALPEPAAVPPSVPRQRGDRPLMVVLDPGHGGIDPGAERAGLREADLMLAFARRLKETLLRQGGFEVLLTRQSDLFLPLEERVSIARAAGADVFISLHADALAEGTARGATVYTLAESASDAAARRLAESHDRADLLAGVDLAGQDDMIAVVLMDLARHETAPRSKALAGVLVKALSAGIGRLHKHPHQSAAFSVLKAPDIPSVLIELGFLSNRRDRANLASAEWQERAAGAIAAALREWAVSDAAQARLLRQ